VAQKQAYLKIPMTQIISVERVQIIGGACLWECQVKDESKTRWMTMTRAGEIIFNQATRPTYHVKFMLGPKMIRRGEKIICRNVFWNNDVKQATLVEQKLLVMLGLGTNPQLKRSSK
jgi:hypothetical protein